LWYFGGGIDLVAHGTSMCLHCLHILGEMFGAVEENFPAVATLPLAIALAEQNHTNMYQFQVSKTAVPFY